MKIRINDLEFKKYTTTKRDTPLYEIVKWEHNSYYGKEEKYRKNGYIDSFGGEYLKKDKKEIPISYFALPETCFVLAFIEKGKESWELRSVGERLLELTPEEWEDFHKVYTLGQNKLNKT